MLLRVKTVVGVGSQWLVRGTRGSSGALERLSVFIPMAGTQVYMKGKTS